MNEKKKKTLDYKNLKDKVQSDKNKTFLIQVGNKFRLDSQTPPAVYSFSSAVTDVMVQDQPVQHTCSCSLQPSDVMLKSFMDRVKKKTQKTSKSHHISKYTSILLI